MRTVQIYINDEILDLFDDENIEVSSSIQNINDIAKVFTDFSQQFTVPASPRNNEIFKHYYQNDVEDGFVAKERQPARIEINFTPFRRGKIQLEGAELVEGEAQHYSITFYGDVVTLKDLFGDDKLRDLDYSGLSFDGSYNEVKTSLTSGGSLDVRYPLISSDRVWQYGGGGSNNIAVGGHAIEFNELFPALRTAKVFELIEAKYGLTFEGNFLTDDRFTSLYTWWKNSNVFTGGKAAIQIPFTSYFPVQPDNVDYEPLENNRIRFKYIDVMQWEPLNDGTWTFNSSSFDGVVSVTATNPATQFVVDVHKNGDYQFSTAVQTGDIYFQFPSFYQNLVGMDDYYEFFVRTNDSDTFVVSGSWFFRYSVTNGSNQTFNNNISSASFNENIVSVTEIDFVNTAPDMLVSDYFSGVLRMFNLTCYPTDENTFQIEPLEFWYSIGEEIDITEYTDVSKIKIDRPKLYNNIEFNWQQSKSLLNVKYRENNNKQYGGLKNFFGYDGADFKIELPFETLLFQKFTGTNLQVSYSLETPPSYKPVIPKATMLYFYPVSQSCSFYLTDGVSTTDEITNYYTFGQETFYNTTDYSINFNEEFSSLSLDTVNNSLYNIYYRAYLQNLFSNKARVVTVETNLPLRLLNSIQLNDALIIRDKKYRINLMKSQLTTGKVTLELITDIVTQPRTIPPTAPPLPVDGGDLVLPIKPIKPIKGGYWTITPAAPYPYITTTPVILVKQTGEVNVKFNVAANGTGTDRTAYYSVNFYDEGDNLYKSEPYVIIQNGTEGYILQENNSLLLQENGLRIRI
jgi:hypothetical protein